MQNMGLAIAKIERVLVLDEKITKKFVADFLIQTIFISESENRDINIHSFGLVKFSSETLQ